MPVKNCERKIIWCHSTNIVKIEYIIECWKQKYIVFDIYYSLWYNYSCIPNMVNKLRIIEQRSNSWLGVCAWVNYNNCLVMSDFFVVFRIMEIKKMYSNVKKMFMNNIGLKISNISWYFHMLIWVNNYWRS
jgi:hypothetical protein